MDFGKLGFITIIIGILISLFTLIFNDLITYSIETIIPIVCIILLLLGLVFSIISLFRKKDIYPNESHKLATTGIVIIALFILGLILFFLFVPIRIY